MVARLLNGLGGEQAWWASVTRLKITFLAQSEIAVSNLYTYVHIDESAEYKRRQLLKRLTIFEWTPMLLHYLA